MPCSNHGPWAAHLTRGVDVLATCCAFTETLAPTCIKRKALAVTNKQERRTQFRQQEGKEGGSEGRKEGRMAEKQRPSSKMLRAPSNLHMILSKRCASHAIYKCWAQNAAKIIQFTPQLLAATPCKHHAAICNICALRRSYFQHVANTIPLATLIFRKPQNSIQFADAI